MRVGRGVAAPAEDSEGVDSVGFEDIRALIRAGEPGSSFAG
jgi:hypothetical protein